MLCYVMLCQFECVFMLVSLVSLVVFCYCTDGFQCWMSCTESLPYYLLYVLTLYFFIYYFCTLYTFCKSNFNDFLIHTLIHSSMKTVLSRCSCLLCCANAELQFEVNMSSKSMQIALFQQIFSIHVVIHIVFLAIALMFTSILKLYYTKMKKNIQLYT